jgi:hypothetical protein
MRILAPLRSAILAFLGMGLAPVACHAQSPAATVDQIVSRMQQARAADRDRGVGYTVTREYQLAPEGASRPMSDVVAEVSYIPPGEKQYVIVKSEGKERGATIVRRVLDHEAAMTAHWQPYALTPENYDFTLLGRDTIDGHDCYLLQLTPRREAPELVRGKAWVDANDFEVRRIEGATAKNPSFWVKNLNLTINYAQVKGVWLETSTHAVAEVRFAGTHVLTSRELEVRRATLSARANKPPSQQHHSYSAADAASWIAH